MNIRDLWLMKVMAPVDGDGADGGSGGSGDAGGDDGSNAGDDGQIGDENGTGGDSGDAGAGDDDKSKQKPTDNEAKLLKEVMQHKNNAKKLQSELEKMGATAGELSNIKQALGDMSAEDIAALVREKKESETKELERKGEYDRIIERMSGENKKIVDSLQVSLDAEVAKRKSLESKIEDLTIGRAFSDSLFIEKNSLMPPSVARREFKGHFEINGDTIVSYDKPEGAADRTMLVDSSGKPKPFDKAIADLYAAHPDAPRLMRSEAKPGAGSKTLGSGGKAPTTTLRGKDRIAAGLEKLSK